MPDIRIPRQKRSIETRNTIIKKGFELMCEKGYFNTSTTNIAEYAKVSTGIIYQYFNDKNDIFIEGVKSYSTEIMYPVLNILDSEKVEFSNKIDMINTIIDSYIQAHTISKKAHEELLAMSHLDENVGNIFKESEIVMTEKIVSFLKNNNINISNPNEKIHIIIGVVDNLCHEVIYHKHNTLNYNVMKEEVVKLIVNLLKDE